jgi:hypothetical protein
LILAPLERMRTVSHMQVVCFRLMWRLFTSNEASHPGA